MADIYSFKVRNAQGKEISLNDYHGKVLLIVNTASACGYTPQYEGLQQLHAKYAERGLAILAFPCNQFGAQEPGDDTSIQSFCSLNYGVTFPVFAKIDVNGKNADPLFAYLCSSLPGILGTESIKWNFTKFLVDRKGQPKKRFAPKDEPKDLESAITALL